MQRSVWRNSTFCHIKQYISKAGTSRTPTLKYTLAWKDYYRYLRMLEQQRQGKPSNNNTDPEKNWTKFKNSVPVMTSSYATVWFEYKNNSGIMCRELILITCVPMAATARDKLDYLAERKYLKDSFEGVTRDFLVKKIEHLEYEHVRKRASGFYCVFHPGYFDSSLE